MKWIQHSTCNAVLGAPRGVPIEECGALPITRHVGEQGQDQIASFWRPDAEELAAINAGHPIMLVIEGFTHAPLFVAVAGIKN